MIAACVVPGAIFGIIIAQIIISGMFLSFLRSYEELDEELDEEGFPKYPDNDTELL